MKLAKSARFHKQVRHGGLFSVKNLNSKILDFSSNVNPLGYPNSVKKSIQNNIKKIPLYPDHNSSELKEKLAKHLDVSTNNLVVANGATEIIYDFCRVMIDKSPVLIAIPTFGEYESASKLCGAKLQFFKTMNLESDLMRFIQKIPKSGLVFLCNPNNPTGTIMQKKSIIQIVKAAKARSSVVFVDECFIELTQHMHESVIDQISKFDNLFVLRSLTKSFGLAGLRLGYGVGNKNLSSVLNKIKIPWSVNGLAQEAGLAALSDETFLAKTQNLIKTESKFLINSISKMNNFSCFDTATNFILINTYQRANLVQKKLLQKNILVRDCSNFRGLSSNYIRIAVKTRRDNQKLVKALRTL